MPLQAGGKAVAYQLLSLGTSAGILLVLSRFIPLPEVVNWLGAHVRQYQPWSTGLYPVVHATCNLLLLPAGVLVIGSGFFFGLWPGFFLALTGHLLGATGAFWITRTIGRRFIERHLASRPQWRELDAAIATEGWKIVFLSQLSPLFPTSLFNYCYGLTRLRYRDCLLWIALGWSPGMFLYAYLGHLGQIGWQVARHGEHHTRAQYALWVGGLAFSVVVTLVLGLIAARMLREARARAEVTQPGSPRVAFAATKSVR